jgi:hypothetical protein
VFHGGESFPLAEAVFIVRIFVSKGGKRDRLEMNLFFAPRGKKLL